MNDLAKRVKPRTIILVGLALAAVLVLRRARSSGGEEIIDPGIPLGGVPAPGFGEDGFVEEDQRPYTIPLPPQGGIVVIPGQDPIIYEPPKPEEDEEAEPPPAAAKPGGAWFGGQFWTSNERKKFRRFWEARQRRAGRAVGEGAWERWLAAHPAFAKALGFPVIPRPNQPPLADRDGNPPPGTGPQATATRDSGHGGQALAAAPGNRRAAVEAPRVVRAKPKPKPLPRSPITRPGARIERPRKKARR